MITFDAEEFRNVLRQVVLEVQTETAPTPESYIDADEAAKYLACGRKRIYELMSSGKLESVSDGTRKLTKRSWADDYLTPARG